MGLGDAADDEQAEARAGDARVEAGELGEHLASAVGRDARPLVPHGHRHVLGVGFQPDLDRRVGRAELGRVRHQLAHGLADAMRVDLDLQPVGPGDGDRSRLQRGGRLVHDRSQVRRPGRELQATGLDGAGVGERHQQCIEEAGAAGDGAHALHEHVAVEPVEVLLDGLGQAEDDGQRCPELVDHE